MIIDEDPAYKLLKASAEQRTVANREAQETVNGSRARPLRGCKAWLFRVRLVRFIADRAAWWLLCSLHPHDLEGSEKALVVGSQSHREVRPGVEPRCHRSGPSSHEAKFLVARRPTKGGEGQTC